MPDDFYAYLRGSAAGAPTLGGVRQRLQTYAATGENLLHCLAFETQMVAIKRRTAIAVLLIDDGADRLAVTEHIFQGGNERTIDGLCAVVLPLCRPPGGSHNKSTKKFQAKRRQAQVF